MFFQDNHNRIKVFILFFLVILVFGFVVSNLYADQHKLLRMATTTSTDNTGILDYLSPRFTEATGIVLQWIAVGTGKALVLGKNCDVDILFVHAPEAEKEFISHGYGIDRRKVMYNDFVIVGPPGDPANIRRNGVEDAFKSILTRKARFISRGDDSGTNKRERILWKKSCGKIPGHTDWYLETGQGMLQTLIIAEEMEGYTLTDRGTYIKYCSSRSESKNLLVILVEHDPLLINQYSVIAVNPSHCKNVQYKYSEKFIEWITSQRGQKLIGEFRLLGKRLFIPNAD